MLFKQHFVFGTVLAVTALTSASLVPENAWDSHIHIIDPDRFPMDPDREYTPKPATVSNATEFFAGYGIKHGVIVLPSPYGTNNAVLLDALERFNGSCRGVAVIDPDTVSNHTLQEYHDAGVRGLRVNIASASTAKIISAVEKNAKVARRFGWVLQLWIPLATFTQLHSIIPDLGVTVVADHFAHAEVGSKTNKTQNTFDPYKTEGFPEVIDLVQRKLLFVKISAPYQNSKDSPLYEDMRVVAESIINAGPDMVVFGSDWPHTASKEGNADSGGRLNPQEYRDINDAYLIESAKEWAGSEAQIRRMFVDNPRRLWQWYRDD